MVTKCLIALNIKFQPEPGSSIVQRHPEIGAYTIKIRDHACCAAVEWVSVGTLDGQVLDKANKTFVELRAMFDLAIEGRLSGREAWAEVMC
jgi:hypothetical protein